jgi:large exoprotein involved in heme utilization and adhesion
MELKIRNVDATTVKKIDEKAKKLDQSWQQFSKNQVHTWAIFNQQFHR